MKTSSVHRVRSIPTLSCILILGVLPSCETSYSDATGSAYDRRDYGQNYTRDLERNSTTSGFGSGVEPVAGYGVGTGGSGWFRNDRALNSMYNYQSR
jgi:hypothetical protein